MMLYFYHKRFSFTAAQFFVLDLTMLVSVRFDLPVEPAAIKFSSRILVVSDCFHGSDVHVSDNIKRV